MKEPQTLVIKKRDAEELSGIVYFFLITNVLPQPNYQVLKITIQMGSFGTFTHETQIIAMPVITANNYNYNITFIVQARKRTPP